MREEVEDKINRLPLRYFDRQPRGELLSRVTNDIDNVSQTLQQTMSQLLTSLLTVRRRAGDDVLDLAAARAGRAGLGAALDAGDQGGHEALAGAVHRAVAAYRQLNAHIEETFSGHALVKVFGRQREVEEVFAERERRALQGSASARSSSAA